MPLDKTLLSTLNVITPTIPGAYRDIGYDLTIGKIYIPIHGWPEGDDALNVPRHRLVESFDVPPQGVVVIFSAETVDVPGDICGYAMPKTSLCSEGVLAFNTGIVDPKYRGLLSATTVNFSGVSRTLKKGDPFLRLVFEPVGQSPVSNSARPAQPFSDQEKEKYYKEKIADANTFPATFLDIPSTVKRVSADVSAKEHAWILRAIAVFGLLFAFLTLVPLYIPKEMLNRAATKDELDTLAKEFADRKELTTIVQGLQADIKTLETSLKDSRDRVIELEKRLPAPMRPTTPMTTPATNPATTPPTNSAANPSLNPPRQP